LRSGVIDVHVLTTTNVTGMFEVADSILVEDDLVTGRRGCELVRLRSPAERDTDSTTNEGRQTLHAGPIFTFRRLQHLTEHTKQPLLTHIFAAPESNPFVWRGVSEPASAK
jgi:hypothetical protein